MKKTKIIYPLVFTIICIVPFLLFFVESEPKHKDLADVQIEFLELNNEIPVIFIPNNKVPAILNMIWYKVGGIDEPENKTGIAHFFEHIIFHNTENFKKGDYDGFLESIGGSNNAFTSFDYTSYFATFPNKYYEQVINYEFDRLNNLIFDADLIENERKIILEERLLRKDNNPSQELLISAKQELFSNESHYARPLIGYEKDLHHISVTDLVSFKKSHYNFHNMFLVVSGDIDKTELLEILNKKYVEYFDTNIAKPKATVENDIIFPEIKTKYFVKETHKTDSYNINWIYRINNFYNQDVKSRYALVILDNMLSGLPNSILKKNFVLDKQIAESASAAYSNISRAGANYFALSFSLSDKYKVTELNKQIALIIQNLKLGRFDQKLFESAKQNLLAKSIYQKESFKTLGYNIGFAYAAGMDKEDIINWDNNIAKVRYRDVIEVATQIFVNDNLVKTYLIPEGDNEFKNMIHE
ncbi:pitrilysin family protein [Rickettsiales bacterium]|nr:pitrilysin family protein [Rickettsiales bacterium]